MTPETLLPAPVQRRAPPGRAGATADRSGPGTRTARPASPSLPRSGMRCARRCSGPRPNGSGSSSTPREPTRPRAHLAQLCAAIRQEASRRPRRPQRGSPDALSRRLLGLIRSAFLDRVRRCRRPTRPSCSACFRPSRLWAEHLEADWSQHFTDRLSAPDGLELVVEVAHDLRSPLTSILFLAETLQRGRSGPVNPVQERQLGLIYSAAFGLSSVASDVIELARGGDRLVDLDPIPFSVTDILESVRDIVQPIAEEKNLHGAGHLARGRFPDRPSGGAQPGAAQPHHQRPQVHRRGFGRGDAR